jgi:hypothetical protein
MFRSVLKEEVRLLRFFDKLTIRSSPDAYNIAAIAELKVIKNNSTKIAGISPAVKVFYQPPFVRIESPDEIKKIRLCDISGRILYKKENIGRYTQIPVEGWREGIYLINVNDNPNAFKIRI